MKSRLVAELYVITLFGVLLTSITALAAGEEGFVVLPDGAPRFSGPQGREEMSPNCWLHGTRPEERSAFFARP